MSNHPSAKALAWSLWGLALACSAVSLFIRLENWPTLAATIGGVANLREFLFWGVLIPIAAPMYATVGALIAGRLPRNVVGWICLILGLAIAVQDVSWQYAVKGLQESLPALPFAAWLGQVLQDVPFPHAFALILLLFPAGRAEGRWRAALLMVTLVSLACQIVFSGFGPALAVGLTHTIDNPLHLPLLASLPAWADTLPNALGAAALVGATIDLVLRWRQAQGARRRQLAWIVYVGAISVSASIMQILSATILGYDDYVTLLIGALALCGLTIGIPTAIGIAVLRFRLYGIDELFDRTLVYGALTATILTIYVLLASTLGMFAQGSGKALVSLFATGVVAVLFQPLRDRLQRAVTRLLYGDRDDPYAAITRLGRQLEAALAPETVLPTIVLTVRESLQLPYVAIFLEQEGSCTATAADGTPSGVPVFLPLVYQGETIGQMALEPRRGETGFSRSDRRLLSDFARQVGVVAHTVRLTTDLQRARERLVAAREEERRRLRRDLHDGLGPQLASQALTLSAARRLLHNNPQAAENLLNAAADQMQDAVADIRRLVYALRPPALDELGLVAALSEHVGQLQSADLDITLDAPGQLPPLPAAVEVAAYRIVQEALTNVVKHAGACNCTVRLSVAHDVEVEVRDNGRGIADHHRIGIGLHSMRERAEELGGVCTIEPATGGGTRVSARLPLTQE